MTQPILLLIAAIILLINLILTIHEAYTYYKSTYSFTAHPGRIRGASDPGPGKDDFVEVKGMRYNVSWIIKEGEFL